MLTSFDVMRDTTLSVNTSLVKLRYQQLDLFNSDALTSAHKVHVHVVFQLHVHVHHSLSCVPLRQYRACVVDSLGLEITYDLYQGQRQLFWSGTAIIGGWQADGLVGGQSIKQVDFYSIRGFYHVPS